MQQGMKFTNGRFDIDDMVFAGTDLKSHTQTKTHYIQGPLG